jgi:hypothetical protein
MKLKCDDGIVRIFQIPVENDYKTDFYNSFCRHCHKEFGVHDTYILKPLFRKHTCKVLGDTNA